MQLEWMGQYRELMEKLIQYGNAYAQNYNREVDLGEGVRFTPAQLQALEYILENEDGCQNMAQIAARLGISPSSFSKNVAKMVLSGEVPHQQQPQGCYHPGLPRREGGLPAVHPDPGAHLPAAGRPLGGDSQRIDRGLSGRPGTPLPVQPGPHRGEPDPPLFDPYSVTPKNPAPGLIPGAGPFC